MVIYKRAIVKNFLCEPMGGAGSVAAGDQEAAADEGENVDADSRSEEAVVTRAMSVDGRIGDEVVDRVDHVKRKNQNGNSADDVQCSHEFSF
jgi:hypothetical protein